MIFQWYNGNVQILGLKTIGPITWSFAIGWNMVGMMIRNVLGIGITDDKHFVQLP